MIFFARFQHVATPKPTPVVAKWFVFPTTKHLASNPTCANTGKATFIHSNCCCNAKSNNKKDIYICALPTQNRTPVCAKSPTFPTVINFIFPHFQANSTQIQFSTKNAPRVRQNNIFVYIFCFFPQKSNQRPQHSICNATQTNCKLSNVSSTKNTHTFFAQFNSSINVGTRRPRRSVIIVLVALLANATKRLAGLLSTKTTLLKKNQRKTTISNNFSVLFPIDKNYNM